MSTTATGAPVLATTTADLATSGAADLSDVTTSSAPSSLLKTTTNAVVDVMSTAGDAMTTTANAATKAVTDVVTTMKDVATDATVSLSTNMATQSTVLSDTNLTSTMSMDVGTTLDVGTTSDVGTTLDVGTTSRDIQSSLATSLHEITSTPETSEPTTLNRILSSITTSSAGDPTNQGRSGTTTVDTMKDFYLSPLIAMSILACLFFLVLLAICLVWYRKRGKTVYKTVNLTPKKPANNTKPRSSDVESQNHQDAPTIQMVKQENGTSADEIGLQVKNGVDNPTYQNADE